MATIKNAALLLLSLAGAPLLSSNSAQALERTCFGEWQSTTGHPEWGDESKCECRLNNTYVRGGVFAAKTGWGYLWSEGRGRVTMIRELANGPNALHLSAYRANGSPFSASNGAGLEELMYDPPNITHGGWTTMYRSMCTVIE